MRVRCSEADRLAQEQSAPSPCPATAGATSPSPMGSSSGGRRCAAASTAALFAAPIAFAFASSAAMRSRWRTISTSDCQTGSPPGERGERPLHAGGVFCVAGVVPHRAGDRVDLGHAPARLHRLVRVAVLHEPFAHDPVGARERGVDVAVRRAGPRCSTLPPGPGQIAARVGIERVLDGGDRARAPRSRPPRAARRPRPRSATRRRSARPGRRRRAPGRSRARRTSGGTGRGAGSRPMNGWVSACMSAPVYTATTPGCAARRRRRRRG